MTAFSDYIENAFVEWMRGNTFPAVPASFYLALYTDATNDAAGGTEVAGGSYARCPLAAAAGTWDAPVSGVTANAGALEFAEPTADWGTVSHWAIHDAAAGGNRILHGALTTPRSIPAGTIASFAIGELDLALTGDWGDYFRHAFINWLRGTTFPAAPANLYAALYTTATDAGSGGTEVSGGAYARVAIAGAWDATSGTDGATENSGLLTFPTCTVNWGTVTHWALQDAAAAGNRIMHKALTTPRTVHVGGVFTFPIGNIDAVFA